MSEAQRKLHIVIFGLSIISSWGNGHATTYRSLVKGLVGRGHRVTFYERRRPWYVDNRDFDRTDLCGIVLYDSIHELDAMIGGEIEADLLMIGSYVPEGARLAHWALPRTQAVTAFYDIDTPVTVAALGRGDCEYLTPALVPEYDVYFSFAGGPILDTLSRRYGARAPRPLFCSVDPDEYFPQSLTPTYDLGYLGTYSPDRQAKLNELLNEPARRWPHGRFCVAGPQYPEAIAWPSNVKRVDHVPPSEHGHFYNSQRFTLNITRQDMVASGYSPSVRLFEAAACGVPIISDPWPGLDEIFVPDQEILIARTADEALSIIRDMSSDVARDIGARALARVLQEHTSMHRAQELEAAVEECRRTQRAPLIERRVLVDRVSGSTLH